MYGRSRNADHQDAIRPEMQRGPRRCDLPQRAIAEVFAIDRRGRKHERNRARREQVGRADHRGNADPLRALPQFHAGARLAERHGHSAAVARRGDRERLQRTGVNGSLHVRKGKGPLQKCGERRVVQQTRRAAMPPCRNEGDEPTRSRSGEVPGIGAIDVIRIDPGPHLGEPRGCGEEVSGRPRRSPRH